MVDTYETVTVDTLDRVMEFDHVIHVAEDGRVSDKIGLYAPELELHGGDYGDGDMRTDLRRVGWGILDGYSQAQGYRGPVMHPSEYIGGGMARDILATPGYYVALVVEEDADEFGERPAVGWIVAYREKMTPYERTEFNPQ